MLRAFVDFKPAQLIETKTETYVSFYCLNPFTRKLERKRIRLNYIHSKTERKKYGRLLSLEINEKLYRGWNPFVEEMESGGHVTITAAIDEFLKAKGKSCRPDSMRSYRSFCDALKGWLNNHGMEKLFCALFNKDLAAKYMGDVEIRGDVSNKTYNNNLAFNKTLFNYFIKRGYVKSNPFSSIEKKSEDEKTREIIPPTFRKRIAEYFIENDMYEYLIIMQLCYRLFVRPKEILMTRIGYIDFEENLLILPPEITKNHKKRILGVPAEIMSYLSTLRDYDPRLYIFSDGYKPGKVLKNTRDTARTWSDMRDALKLPKEFQFYSLKDTGITEMLEAGVPAKYVKELADHHSLEMTEKYTHRSDAKKILEYNKLEF